MSRPDRRAARPALMPLEGRQLLTAGASTRPAASLAAISVVSKQTMMPHAFAPLAAAEAGATVTKTAAGMTGITLRVAAPTSVTHRVTIPYVVAPAASFATGLNHLVAVAQPAHTTFGIV